jgi:hypothetical protein
MKTDDAELHKGVEFIVNRRAPNLFHYVEKGKGVISQRRKKIKMATWPVK